MAFINNSFFSFLIISTGNDIGERGAISLSESLKSNTTLTEFYLSCEDKRKKTQMTSINNSLVSLLFTSTDNKIGETGATSLSEALKSNTTLTELYLNSEGKRKNTQMKDISSSVFSFLFTTTGGDLGKNGVISLSEALKSNATLTKLNLYSKDKRKKTHK